MSLETLTEEWYKARKSVLELYSDTDTWMKEKGKGTEVTDLPISLTDALKNLSNAEWALFDYVKERSDG